MAEPHRGLALRATNQLVRQQGKSNLLDGKPPAQQSRLVAQRRVTTTTAQSAFTVFEDSSESQQMDENNVIHMLEKKCQEEKMKASQEKKITSVLPARRVRGPLQEKTINVRPDSDDELYSARSQATDASVTNNLLHLEVADTTTCSGASSLICDETEDFQSTQDDEIERESRLYGAPQFDEHIYEYMCSRETKIRPKPDFLKKQKEITKEMRVILVDWLFEVVGEYTMSQETFHLAISLVDRVLSVFRVEKDKLQLIGGTALMIAAKFEEIYPPETKDYVYMTDDSYKLKDFRLMERAILLELHFDISIPTAVWFANRLTSQLVMTQQVRHAIEYVLDLTLLEPSYLEFKPSYVAAACICYANVLCGEEAWNGQLELHSGIRLEHLQKIFLKLHDDFVAASKSKSAIYQNYSDSGKLEVSKMQAPTKMPFE